MPRKTLKKHESIDEANVLLADPTRFQIYRTVIGAGGSGMTTAEVAGRFGLHRNVARMHLEKLARAGMLVSSSRQPPGGGRPARLYRLGETVTRQYPPRDFQLLAHVTLTALEEKTDPRKIARRIGRVTGEGALRSAGLVPETATREKLMTSLRSMAEEHGIFARIEFSDDGQMAVTAFNCIFRELAAGHSRLVCGLHTQMLMGMFEAHFGKVRIKKGKLEIAGGGTSCRFRVIFAS